MPTSCAEVASFVKFLCEDSENPSRGKGRDVEQVVQTLKHIFVFVFVFVFVISQFNSTCLYLALLLLFNS